MYWLKLFRMPDPMDVQKKFLTDVCYWQSYIFKVELMSSLCIILKAAVPSVKRHWLKNWGVLLPLGIFYVGVLLRIRLRFSPIFNANICFSDILKFYCKNLISLQLRVLIIRTSLCYQHFSQYGIWQFMSRHLFQLNSSSSVQCFYYMLPRNEYSILQRLSHLKLYL